MLNYNFLINPFSSDMHISPTIHYNAGHSYKINTGADEFVAINFLPGKISSLTLLVLMSLVLTNYVSVHVSVQVLVEVHAVEQ